jgi:hypothetical protein
MAAILIRRAPRLLKFLEYFEAQMKLQYLATGPPDCPLIRLYDFTAVEAIQLHAAFACLAAGAAERVEVHHLLFVEVVGSCRLALIRSGRDQAVIQVSQPAEFECRFTDGTWDNVAGLAEPFAEGARGFQWLAGQPGETSLLLSSSGLW